jgi:hypothetical protein
MKGIISSTKLSAKAKILKNLISVEEEGSRFEARPLGWNEKGLVGALQRHFTLKYFLFKGDEVLSEMRYDDIHDKFVIVKQGQTIIIDSSDFSFGGRKYQMKSSLTRLEISEKRDGKRIIVGKAKFGLSSYSIEFEKYPEQLKEVIKEFAVLYMVKKIVWSMISPI